MPIHLLSMASQPQRVTMPTTIGKRVLSFRNPVESVNWTSNEEDSRNGSSVRDWRNRFKHGLDCSTSYTRLQTEVVSVVGGNWFHRFGFRANSLAPWVDSYTASAYGSPTQGFLGGSVVVPDNVENSVKGAFLDKMDNTRKALQSITVLGEIGETVKQILHPMASLRRGISAYFRTVEKRGSKALRLNGRRTKGRSADPRDNLTLRKVLSGTYLEFVFGIQPTLSDIQSGIEAAHRLGGRAVDSQRISAASSWESLVSFQSGLFPTLFSLVGDGPFSGPIATASVTMSREIRVKGRLRYSGNIGIEVKPSVQTVLGFAPRDFLPDVWNFLPWSWAIDYAFNVGNVLQALTASYSDLLWCNRAVTLEVLQTDRSDGLIDRWQPVDPNHCRTLGLLEMSPSRVQYRQMEYSRAPVSASITSFMPVFSLRMPGPQQLLNLAAVAHQQVRISKQFRAKPSGPEFSRLDDLHLIR